MRIHLSRTLMAGAVAVAASATAFVIGSSVGQSDASSPSQELRVIEAHNYPVDSSPRAALKFPMNANVFSGTVVATLPDAYAADTLKSGAVVEAVYTPVQIRVISVLRGRLEAGEMVIVRSLGGTAAGVQFIAENAPSKATFTRGSTLTVFAGVQERIDTEPIPAMTPNFVYSQVGQELVDSTYSYGSFDGGPRARVGKAKFVAQLRTALGAASKSPPTKTDTSTQAQTFNPSDYPGNRR